ncbi:MAG TPA: porin [Caulobacteraceae bacterium]|jgi:phosphate-selective porin OprO/OprP|nr:porin [Caulobacteraceae bacterium]
MLAAGVSSVALAQAAPAAQDPREARIDQLEAEVQDLAAQVQDLKRGQAAQIQTLSDVQTKQAPPPSVVASITNGVPSIASADGRFLANFHGILQFDAGGYDQSGLGPLGADLRRSGPALGASASNVDLTHARELKNGDNFRRARIGVDGRAFGDWDYKLIFDFAGSGVEDAGQLYEGWIQYSGLKPVHLRVGAFSPSIGLEDQASTNGMPLLERTAVEDIARGFVAGDTRTAVELWGAGDHWLASAALTGRVIGVLNTGTAAAVPQSYGDQLGVVARVAGTPFHGSDWFVHVGAHGSYLIDPPNLTGPTAAGLRVAPNAEVVAFSNTPELRIDGTKLINTGNIPASHASTTGLEFAAEKQNFYLQSEYDYFTVNRTDVRSTPTFSGYYVEGGWVITGEPRVYNRATAALDGPIVAHPFSLNGEGLGAFELVARYSDMDLNYHQGAAGTAPSSTAIRGGDEQNVTLGLNWYPNQFTKFMFEVSEVEIHRLSPCTNTGAGAANTCTGTALWQTPVGAQIGQNFTDFAIRSQFAF